MDIVDRVIRGDFGNGEERKRRPLYGFVQNEVNERLGYSIIFIFNIIYIYKIV